MSGSGPMDGSEWTDEMLMAFVDGELDQHTTARIASAVAAEPALAQRVDDFRESSRLAREVFGKALSEPVPDRLVDAILSETNVVPLKQRRSLSQRLLPLAASVMLVAGFGAGLWFGERSDGAGGQLLEGGEIAALLATQPSGPAAEVSVGGQSARLSVLGSYEVVDGLCRMFRLDYAEDAVRGIACDHGSGFGVEMAVADTAGSGFSPASERATSMADAYLDSIEAGAPLDAADEARLLGEHAKK